MQRPGSLIDESTATFLGEIRSVLFRDAWQDPQTPKLWLYNLHYFDGLLADDQVTSTALKRFYVDRWIAENPPASGVGWDPYPCSLRICNWIKWLEASGTHSDDIERSLSVQAAWLARNVEWHLLGNHLFENARALVFAGHFFAGREANEWLERGLRILERELPEQVLPDGAHFELSPMYHLIILEGLLDLLNVATIWPGRVPESTLSQWRNCASRMRSWLDAMCHPDGEIALFNDSAFGIASPPDRLSAYANSLDIPNDANELGVTHLLESGYVSVPGPNSQLILDVGEIGPDYLPAHAHADTLSFELSVFGRRLIVDSGCSTYEANSERLRQRGTAAHNTITVDGEDSSEVWSSFRVARRARPSQVKVISAGSEWIISASHDGFMRLPGKVMHERTWTSSGSRLEIRDVLSGRWSSALAFLLFHPDVELSSDNGNIRCSLMGQVVMLEIQGGAWCIENATWHPEFGSSITTSRVRVNIIGSELLTAFDW